MSEERFKITLTPIVNSPWWCYRVYEVDRFGRPVIKRAAKMRPSKEEARRAAEEYVDSRLALAEQVESYLYPPLEELGCPPGCRSPFCACPGTD